MKQTQFHHAVIGLVALALLASACASRPTPAPVPLPTAIPATPTPLPERIVVPYIPQPQGQVTPVVIYRSPESGERLSPSGSIELVFDRAMDQASVATAWQLQPAVNGAFTWKDARTLSFKPAADLPRNTVFDVALTQDAKATDGSRLGAPYQFRLTTQGNLEVGQTIPAGGATDIDPDTRITVLFNRPVVPLTTLAQQAGLPQPLSCSPAVDGKAEWLNTSILVLEPTKPFPGGTQFTCTVKGDLQDTEGNPMAGDFTWSFSTAAPKVTGFSFSKSTSGANGIIRSVNINPSSNAVAADDTSLIARVDTGIVLEFNQPIDAASAQASFRLLQNNGPIAGQFEITGTTLIFTPTQRMNFEAEYQVSLAAGVLSASGGIGSKEGFDKRFNTVPLPRIVGTEPENGQVTDNPSSPFIIKFNTDIDPATVMSHLTMTANGAAVIFTPTQVYTYFDGYNKTFVLNFGSLPATDYAVNITPGIADPYGNVIEQGLSLTYRTGDAPPSVQIALPYGAATFDARQPVRVVASTLNVSQIEFAIFKLADVSQINDLIYRYDTAPPENLLVRRFTQPIATQSNRTVRTLVDLGEGEGKLEPGLYLLTLRSPQMRDNFVQRAALFVSEINLTLKSEPDAALAWATDLQSGQPVADLAVDFYAVDYSNGQNTLQLLGSAATNADGVAQFQNTTPITATSPSQPRPQISYAVARGRFSGVSSDWANGIRPYDFGISFGPSFSYYGDDVRQRAYLYTDRPIYRPGQKVFVKGILRAEDDVKYSLLPAGTNVIVRVSDPTGQQLSSETKSLDENGALNFEVTLQDGAALGMYSMQVEVNGSFVGASSFTVAAYRPPEFEVQVTPSITEALRGTSIDATVQARYLSGGALRNARVSWNVLVRGATFSPPQLDQYTFTDYDDPWRCTMCWFSYRNDPPPQPVLQGEGVTDENGDLKITVPISAELRDSSGELISGPVELSIEANVTGADDQSIAGLTSVTAHPAEYYLGLATHQYVIQSNKPVTMEVIAVDLLGGRLAGKSTEVTAYRREWTSKFIGDEFGGRWESEVNDELITQTTTTSDGQGLARLVFTPTQAGTYRVVAHGTDSGGRIVQSSRYVWATGSEYVPWLRQNNDQVNLVANKTSFVPGETAHILIPSPFINETTKEHWALVTIERGHVRQQQVIKITSSSQTLDVPITAEFAPNVFVSVVLMKGSQAVAVSSTSTSTTTNPTISAQADYKMGLIGLKVEPVQQTLSVVLSTTQQVTQPGQAVTYTMQVRDAAGNPVAGQFSLDLVDKGILNLLPRTPDEILQTFYGLRNLRVNTAVGLSVSGNRITNEQQQQFGLGRGGGPTGNSYGATLEMAAAPAAPSAASAPAQDAVAARQSAAAPAAGLEVRENFADTGYWAPTVTTDANGQATVSITLPDNLTTWVLRAVGLDNQTRVGEGTVNVVATKPLLIRPVTPRFLVVGDVVELGAIINNNTDTPQTAEVSLGSDEISSSVASLVFGSEPTQQVTIPAQGEMRVNWVVTVTDVPQVNLVFAVQNEQYNDASKPRLTTAPNGGLKVNKWSAPEVVGTAGDLPGEGSRTEIIGLPPGLDTTQGEVTLRLDPSLAASMQAGLTYLETYPYDCAEQLVSKFLPNVLTYRALKELGLTNAELEARLPTLVNDSLSRLTELQNSDGGWGWWRNEESNPNISAYVVFGMLKAREAGFNINVDTLQRGVAYLQTTKTMSMGSMFDDINYQAYVLYVLAEAGSPDALSVNEIYRLRDNLSYYAKALLALAIGKQDATDTRIKTLLADLNGAAIQSATGVHWEEQNVDWWAMNSDTRTTAIVLAALVQLDSENNLNPNIVRWLMVARNAGGYWRSTQETAWSLIALTDWMRFTGELKGNYPFGAFLNDRQIASGQVSTATLTQTTIVTLPIASLLQEVASGLATGSNRLTISRGPMSADGDGTGSAGRLYYTAHLKAYFPVPELKAQDRGIAVQRRYTLASCTDGIACADVTQAKVGDVIRVNLTLIAPSDLYYVQLEDPIPAGADLIDTGLATTSQLASGPTLNRDNSRYGWWWNWYSRSELRDDRVALFASRLGKGTYEYSYTFRVTSAGQFNVIPTFVNEQYFPEVFGRSDGMLLTVTR